MGGVAMSKLGDIAATDFAIQIAGWAAASALHTEKFYDATGALTYWTVMLKAYSYANRSQQRVAGGSSADSSTAGATGGASVRQKVVTSMVLAWSLRLGLFLAARGWKYGDSRFDKVKHQPKNFLIFWLLQGFWCFLTPLPAYLLLSKKSRDTAPLGLTDYAAWLGWAVGFAAETIADHQKSAFKETGDTGFMQSGIWRYSQHPNYFGEILLWMSLCVTCNNGIEGLPAKLASLASPSFVSYLLMCVSGVPLLQKAAMKKYGGDPAFLAYRARTSLVVPLPNRAA